MRNLQIQCCVFAVVAGMSACAQAKVVGQNTPANPLTAERIRAEVQKAQQGEWLAYVERSAKQQAADRAAFAAEVPLSSLATLPKQSSSAHSIPLHKDAAWYGSADALKIADTIVSFQIPNGGWSKNLDMTQPARVLGEFYATDDLNRYPDAKDYDAPHDPHWNYVGTLDNDATNTELTFLRRVITVLPADKAQRYRASYLRGIDYLLQSQFPNGGWPQVWPLQGGYHDAITFNDDAVTESLESLKPVADGEVTFVPVTTRKLAAVAFARGLQCVLATQVTAQGKKTVWAQQNDPLTLEPVSARNYEMPALASGESAPVLEFLMEQSKPSPAIREAVEAGVAWFKATAIYGYTWGGTRAEGRHLSKADGAGPIWARYYSLTTDTPIFGDRDKTIHDDVSEISLERRNGYAWYNGNGVEVLAQYKNWLALRKQAMGTGH
jgi:PelA/Pel-15E family pectate lyase